MIECTTEQSSLTFKWTFNRMMPSLPTPGTTAFATLCRALQPYGISPSGISLQAPTNWLSDVSLRISLLEAERAILQITYGGFEIFINYLSHGDDAVTLEMLKIIFEALIEIDNDAISGNAKIVLNAHLRLDSSNPDAFLHKHLIGGETKDGLAPDLFYYRILLGNDPAPARIRIGVTTSVQFENAIFAELTAEYNDMGPLEQIGDRFEKDCRDAFAKLGLSPKSAPMLESQI